MKPVFSIRLSAASLLRRILAWRFLKFGIVGASGTVINLGLLYYSREYLFAAVQPPELRLNLSLALAIFFATLNNFCWNRMWTWADRKQHYGRPIAVQFGQYTLSCWLSIALQAVFTNLLALHFYYLVANLIAIAMTSVLNFVLNDLWTFGRLKLLRAQTSHHASSAEQKAKAISEKP
ncbi:MAG: GtrA family protein [Nitrosomonadales bacterium]|nr:GtrA family protein [Nitrosomonadales bacterium]